MTTHYVLYRHDRLEHQTDNPVSMRLRLQNFRATTDDHLYVIQDLGTSFDAHIVQKPALDWRTATKLPLDDRYGVVGTVLQRTGNVFRSGENVHVTVNEGSDEGLERAVRLALRPAPTD